MTTTVLVAMILVAAEGLAIVDVQSMTNMTLGMDLELATLGAEVLMMHGNAVVLLNGLADVAKLISQVGSFRCLLVLNGLLIAIFLLEVPWPLLMMRWLSVSRLSSRICMMRGWPFAVIATCFIKWMIIFPGFLRAMRGPPTPGLSC